MSKHTSGPWKQWRERTLDDGTRCMIVGDESGWPVALVLGGKPEDASLVAAAPDLLIVVQLLTLAPLQHGVDLPEDLLRQAQRAIKKATGAD